MKITLLIIFPLINAFNIPHNILPTSNKIDLFNYDKEDLLNGIDTRNIKHTEPSIEELIEIHWKHKLYLHLSSNKLSLPDKEKLAKQYFYKNSIMSPTLYSGGLLDDWEFECFL